jgi:hypothetical protein
MFIVYQYTPTREANGSLWGSDVDGGWNRLQLLDFPALPSVDFGMSMGDGTVSVTGLNTSNRLIYTIVIDQYTISIFVNGTSGVTPFSEPESGYTSDTNTYFAAIAPFSFMTPINFNEIVIYDRAITTTQRQQIEGYLAWKWGLQSQLPFIHPYYKFRTSQLAVKPLTPSTIATVILEDLNGYNGTVTWTVSTNATNYIMIVGTGPGTGEVARDYRGDVLSGIVSYSFAENIDYYAWVIPVSSTGTAGIPTISPVASYGPPP